MQVPRPSQQKSTAAGILTDHAGQSVFFKDKWKTGKLCRYFHPGFHNPPTNHCEFFIHRRRSRL
jgi:hypothetical protein